MKRDYDNGSGNYIKVFILSCDLGMLREFFGYDYYYYDDIPEISRYY